MFDMPFKGKDKPRLTDDHQKYAEEICREATPLKDKTMNELLPWY